MTLSADFEVTVGPVRAIPVPATSSGGRVVSGPCTLYGWSIADNSGDVPQFVENQVTSPGALATIASLPIVPPGQYILNVTVELEGTVAAADADNFQITGVPGGPIRSDNLGAVGIYPQPEEQFELNSLGAITVQSVAAGTVGAIYKASIELKPLLMVGANAQLNDGNSILGMIQVGAGGVDTEWFGPMGITVWNQVTLVVTSGAVKGAVFVGYSD